MSSELSGLNWYALRVKTQHEKMVALALRQKGYEEFLPTYRLKRRWSDRLKELERPLFDGYVFCRFEIHKRLPILVTPGVSHIVGAGKIAVPVTDTEIENMKSIVTSQLPVSPWPFLRVGQTVRVSSGSLAGLEGILIAKKPFRLVVSVSLLQRSVAVEIDEEWVIPVSSVVTTPLRRLQGAQTVPNAG